MVIEDRKGYNSALPVERALQFGGGNGCTTVSAALQGDPRFFIYYKMILDAGLEMEELINATTLAPTDMGFKNSCWYNKTQGVGGLGKFLTGYLETTAIAATLTDQDIVEATSGGTIPCINTLDDSPTVDGRINVCVADQNASEASRVDKRMEFLPQQHFQLRFQTDPFQEEDSPLLRHAHPLVSAHVQPKQDLHQPSHLLLYLLET